MNHYANLIWFFDFLFFTIILFSALFAIAYLAFEDGRIRRRLFALAKLRRRLRSFTSRNESIIERDINEFLRRLTTQQTLDLTGTKEKFIPKKFERQFRNSLIASEKINEIEHTAEKSRNKWSKIEAIICLGYAGSPRTLGILKVSLYDKDEDISYFSMIALGSIKTENSAVILLDFIGAQTFSGQKIISLLERFPKTIIGEVLKGTENFNSTVRFWSTKLLSRLESQNSIPRLLVLTKDVSPDVRAAACESLGTLEAKAAEPVLLDCLKDSAWFVRMQAVRALSKISGKKHVPELIKLLMSDEMHYVKESVKNAILADRERAFGYLEQCVLEGDHRTKKYCVDAFVEMNYIQELLEGILSQDSKIYAKSFHLLSQLVQSGIHFGLKRNIDIYAPEARRKLIEVISTIDLQLAERIREGMPDVD